jgi:hypothetical protein
MSIHAGGHARIHAFARAHTHKYEYATKTEIKVCTQYLKPTHSNK